MVFHHSFIITVQCTDIQVQFQQSNSTEAREDKDSRIFLRILVMIEPPTAILGTEVTLNFSVVAGNATGKLDTVYMCYRIAGNVRGVQIFAIFTDRPASTKIKTAKKCTRMEL